MFDFATRPQPNSTNPGAVVGVPFDLRLTQAGVDVLATHAMALEDTLATAVILSLFTDRRASRDDTLPAGTSDRRGWIGDEFTAEGNDTWGSALWLCFSGKVTDDVLERARFAAQESLAWLVRDGIASRVEVSAQWVGPQADRLAVRPTIWQPGQESPVYDVLWGTSIARWTSL